MKYKKFEPGERYYSHNYNIPKEVKFCKVCVISNQRPRITFNSEGVCSACEFTDFKEKIDWAKREKELSTLLDKHRKHDGSYDVIVPSSGGKDSGYVAHQLKYIYKMNPLTLTWAPHIYTEIGFQNQRSHINVADLSNIMLTPPGKLHRKLSRLSLKIIGDPFMPFIAGQMNVPLQIAKLYNIPLIFFGENNEMEYCRGINDPERNDPTINISVRFPQLFSGVFPHKFIEAGITKSELKYYLKPDEVDLKKINIQMHYFGYYKKWLPQENYYYCVNNTGFKPNPVRTEGTYSKYASLDDKLDGFHYYLMFIKFGIGRATADAAHEVRDGRLSREEAVELVAKYDSEFPKKYYKDFLEYCDITEEEFNNILDSWRPSHIWRKRNTGEWLLKHTINHSGTDD